MSYSAYAYLIYGIGCDKSDITREETRPSCSHSYDENFKHCPHCGKPQMVYNEVNIDEDDDISWFSPDYESKTIIVGIELGSTGYNKDMQEVGLPSEETINSVKVFLNEYGLEGEPGLHLMLRHSY